MHNIDYENLGEEDKEYEEPTWTYGSHAPVALFSLASGQWDPSGQASFIWIWKTTKALDTLLLPWVKVHCINLHIIQNWHQGFWNIFWRTS